MWFKQMLQSGLRFIIVMLLILTVAEGILRLLQHNKSNILFREIALNRDFMELNPDFLQKFNARINIPSASFKKKKGTDTIRIFVIGGPENTILPENPNSWFSHILHNALQKTALEKNIELVRVPIDPADYRIQNILPQQLKRYNADFVLLCPGWSTSGLNQASVIQNRYLQRLYIVRELSCLFAADVKSSLTGFETNLDNLVISLQEQGIAVALLNTSRNLDFPPQKSCFSSIDSVFLNKLFITGKKAYLNKSFDVAYACFTKVFQKDRTHAETLFYLGKLSLKNNEISIGRKFLMQAARNDHSNSRLSLDINTIISKISVIRGCCLVDIENAFSDFSMNGIPGSNLFSGPRMINLAGNILIAKTCFKILVKEGLIKKGDQYKAKLLALTPFDKAYDRILAEAQTQDKSICRIDNNMISNAFEERTAELLASQQTNWEESMNSLFNYYIKHKDYNKALKIIENLALENPYNISINDKASRTASLIGDSQLVVHYAKKVYNLHPDVEVAQRIFLNYLKLDMPENALPYLEYARMKKDKGNDLSIIYKTTRQIINLKKLLNKNPLDREIRTQIALRYEAMGNTEIASLYASSPASPILVQ